MKGHPMHLSLCKINFRLSSLQCLARNTILLELESKPCKFFFVEHRVRILKIRKLIFFRKLDK